MATASKYSNDAPKEAPKTSAPATVTTRDFEVPELSAITAGTWPSPIDTFRTTVAGVALVGLIPVGDEKTAYPTGTPQTPGSKFWMRNGFYKSATPT
jgi:hypothetical protein